jgi:hypothetical protein
MLRHEAGRQTADELRVSDAAVVARYLQVRSHFHHRLLPRIDAHMVGAKRADAAPLTIYRFAKR